MREFQRLFQIIYISFFCLSLLAVASPSAAASDWQRSGPVEARLISAVEAVGNTSELTFGLDLKLDDGWKTYWRMPGDAGLPPQLDWSASKGIKNVEILYPAPKRFSLFGYDNFGYANKILFPLTVTPQEIGQGLTLDLSATLLICKDVCIPQNISLTHSLSEGTATPSPFAKAISGAIKLVPEAIKITSEELNIDIADDNAILLSSPLFSNDITDLFLENSNDLVFAKPVKLSANTYKLALNSRLMEGDNYPEMIQQKPLRLTITFKDKNRPAANISFMYQDHHREIADTPAQDGLSLGYVLILAFIGGLILNLMPCVLPVLSLKLLSIVSHGGSEKGEIRKGFIASAAGILFSFMVLATSLFIVKQIGGAVGWGIQFQNPWFLSFMILLVTFFAINLWGTFEIPLPRFIAKTLPKSHDHEPTLTGHFLTGALATLLATPCTAPFLGTAVGFALSQGVIALFTVFFALGLGLASPYLAVAAFPIVAQHLPKPGQWMITLKKILAVAMLLTSVWLGSVLVNVLDGDNGTGSLSQEGDVLQWVAFNPSDIQKHVAEGKTVFVDVTADWCLTCQANKKIVIYDTDVIKYLTENNVVMMKADWTEPNEEIANYLKSYNRYGIPFNIIYGPGAPEGRILPELLSEHEVLKTLRKVPSKK